MKAVQPSGNLEKGMYMRVEAYGQRNLNAQSGSGVEYICMQKARLL